ncbi:MAG: DNA polymerase III subunit epsilon [Burkholderiales bacterium]|nr:DNA polymerase III subunit epsilon [Pseudomonadota bacterium]MCC7067306.1 DNA polymerase III subunit epsilon [Burkholderiales bacterium]MCZ2136014.1 DNA polymerase III subunit epsilon [Burkholderiales bacterium]
MEANERIVFVDTETTGLEPKLGHRLIEIAGIEAIGRDLTGRRFHYHLDPERDVDAGATAIHGYTWDDLKGKPKFAAVVDELIAFLSGAQVVIHNARFDVSFLDQELARLRRPTVTAHGLTIVDSLALAREKYPGKRNTLDALCDRFGIDHTQRTLHGALLDARLLAEVYFALTRGQGAFDMEAPVVVAHLTPTIERDVTDETTPLRPITPSGDALAEHAAYLNRLAQQTGRPGAW